MVIRMTTPACAVQGSARMPISRAHTAIVGGVLRVKLSVIRGVGIQLKRSRRYAVPDHLADIEAPEVAEDIRALQENVGAEFNADGVAVSFGKELDEKASTAWKSGMVLVDRSHTGRFRVTGEDRVGFLHSQSTQDVARLRSGDVSLTVFVSRTGRVIDLSTLLIQSKSVLVLCSENASSLMGLLQKNVFPMDHVHMHDVSVQTRVFTLLGPEAASLVREWGGDDLVELTENKHMLVVFDGAPVVVFKASSLGNDVLGWTFIVDESMASEFWRRAILKGALPMGERVWEHVRICKGVPRLRFELTEEVNALEAGLAGAISLEKGCYLGQETLAKVTKSKGLRRRLWGLRLRAGSVCRPGDMVAYKGTKVGHVTSATQRDQSSIALAYLKTKVNGKPMSYSDLQLSVQGEPCKVFAIRSLSFEVTTSADAAQPHKSASATVRDAGEQADKLARMREQLAKWQDHQQEA